MEINFSGKNSIDVVTANDNEKCFMCCNTTEYNGDGNCGVTVGDIETMKKLGWDSEEDLTALNGMKIGQKYEGREYWGSVFVIRLA